MKRLRSVLGRDAADEGGGADASDTSAARTSGGQHARTSGDRSGRPPGADEPGVGLFVDGPNVLREEFDVDLDDVRAAADSEGRLVAARLYLDEHATPGLIQAAEARGFEVTVTSGDVDVKLAVDATAFVVGGGPDALAGGVDVLALASRDTDFKPVLEAAASHGVRTVAVAPGEHGRSDALRNAAHEAYVIEE